MAHETFFRVWQGIRRGGRCRDCRKPMIWRTTDQKKELPFQPDATPIRVDIHPETGARFDVFAPDALHSRVCRKKKRTTPKPASPRAAQQRLL